MGANQSHTSHDEEHKAELNEEAKVECPFLDGRFSQLIAKEVRAGALGFRTGARSGSPVKSELRTARPGGGRNHSFGALPENVMPPTKIAARVLNFCVRWEIHSFTAMCRATHLRYLVQGNPPPCAQWETQKYPMCWSSTNRAHSRIPM